ncbi:MAG: acyl-CoA dehydrogenase [Porticoccaceae bacterium]|nr:MAG: acyl-CoA dehydrogenase [Porticoccaceae bacterium]
MDYGAFRREVRAFLDEALTPRLKRAGQLQTSVFADFEATMEWHRILYRKGWVAPDWPPEYGGTGWDLIQRHIFQEECKLADAPSLLPMGLQMLGPLLIRYGTEAQKAHYLPRILSGEDVWCQGYSEPGAGSDLASLKTRAVRDGDHYVVDGSKIWTSMAHHANRIFCLVRTANTEKPQAGISFLLVDMATPGITVRPIVGLDGRVEQCEVFFDGVRVPVENRVGAENQGWEVAKYLLAFERGGHHFAADHKKQLRRIARILAAEADPEGRLRGEDPDFCARLAAAEVEALALEYTELRVKGGLAAGASPGALSSLIKVAGCEIGQRLDALALEAAGLWCAPFQPEALSPDWTGTPAAPDHALTAMACYVDNRASTIYGGAAEVQRDIMARHLLGL